MKRQLKFDLQDGQYVITEDDDIIFSIDGKELKFISLDFYNGVYKDKTAAIELTYIVGTDAYKKGRYIFEWLKDIINSIQAELNDPEIEDPLEAQEAEVPRKVVYFYELAACAGSGFYSGEPSRPDQEIESPYPEADYAVRISGKSMEPTITDGSIVFVKQVAELNDGEIGIFVIDGNVMCKRLRNDTKNQWLQPDNSSEFEPIELTDDVNCIIQGKVLLP